MAGRELGGRGKEIGMGKGSLGGEWELGMRGKGDWDEGSGPGWGRELGVGKGARDEGN